ncbi:protein TIC 40, chloroplastic isoform X1 [Diospyros lotus]|uniref:protein TIC 40, chloroplastic isoform X1 n=1 Tax=Diospyros lotus TaxID=55363 RepID=UPI0022598216|nr:protein TIC 40, chloroplastic isoform X1 [Diospyros lotus]
MENLALVCASSPKIALGANPNDGVFLANNRCSSFGLPLLLRKVATRRTVTLALSQPQSDRGPAPPPLRLPKANVLEKVGRECFASVTSSNSQETSSVGVNPQLAVPPPSSNFGSPLFWIGVGVGLSALFSWVATNLKKYAMQQAFKTLMGQMDSQNKQVNNAAFSPGSPFPFPFPTPTASSPATSPPFPTYPQPGPSTSPSPATSPSAVTVDVPVTKVEVPPPTDAEEEPKVEGPKKYAFIDVSPEETLPKSPFGGFEETATLESSKNAELVDQVSQNGTASASEVGVSQGSSSTREKSSVLSVEALEKMMEDPTVQKMVYPYLPEEMRNPDTFKWMLQNPQYRQQLEDMLNNMGGSTEWDNQMLDSLKNFDLSSPEVKQQFDQIGLTPEEVISKIMANPDVAMAFQNPRVQAAIMECSQNPLSIAKYQNDKEVMDVFNKISELFPGVTGP